MSEPESKVYILGTQAYMEKALKVLCNEYYQLEDMLYLLIQYWYFGGEKDQCSEIVNEIHSTVTAMCAFNNLDEETTEKECSRVWRSLEEACLILIKELTWLDEVDLDLYHPTAVNEVGGDLYVQFEPLPKWAGSPTV